MVGRTSILQRTVSFAFFVVSMKRGGGGSNVVWLGELRAIASVGWAFRHFFGLHFGARVESRHFFGLHSGAQVESRHFFGLHSGAQVESRQVEALFWPLLRGSGGVEALFWPHSSPQLGFTKAQFIRRERGATSFILATLGCIFWRSGVS